MYQTKICRVCGEPFQPKSSRQLDCNKPVVKICQICGKEFESRCSKNDTGTTCSLDCKNKLASLNRQHSYMAATKICELCGQEFNPRSNTQKICERDHFRTCIICKNKFKLNYKPNMRLAELRTTCSKECLSKLKGIDNPFSRPEVQDKIKKTNLERYGYESASKNGDIMKKAFETYKKKTGFDHPSHNPQTRKGKNYHHSTLEQIVETALLNNQIRFEREHLIQKGKLSHSFDFYLPDYNILVDADGQYYHGYLDDSNGYQIDEERDDMRLSLIPEDHLFHVIVEQNKKEDIDNLIQVIKAKDLKCFNYSEYMFNWCRSIDFPYPCYAESRLRKDYANLTKLSSSDYHPRCRIGLSTIRHFHRSIYSAHVGNSPSIIEGWNDDQLLRKCISNRMLYVNNVDPSKILAGFYISKIAGKVSVFNPVLAKYLCENFAKEYKRIVDPFSGYSGRLLGCCAAGKEYLGWDLNSTAVAESQQVIQFHSLNAKIEVENILESNYKNFDQDCLLTCPPYSNKEIYSTESTFKTCDEWIEWVMSKYNCAKYIFVVNKTNKFVDNVVMQIDNKSYFSNSKEYVIVI